MMDKKQVLEIQSILGTTQREDHLEFEIALIDSNGNSYVARFTVRNHNIGFFNRALRRLRPMKIFGQASSASHNSPKTPGSHEGPGNNPPGDHNV